MRHARLLLLILPILSLAAASAPQRLPALVFVSRSRPEPGMAGAVPGLGPRHHTLATGGQLLVRESNGRFRLLLPAGTLYDASDPCVSWDGKKIAFAGTVARDSAWRIYLVGADGRGLAAITRSDRALDLSPLGCDPKLCESGQWKGRVRMSKRGVELARTALFQAATCAMLHDPDMKAVFDRKRAEGKFYLVCVSHVMRLQLRRLVAVLYDRKPFVRLPLNLAPAT